MAIKKSIICDICNMTEEYLTSVPNPDMVTKSGFASKQYEGVVYHICPDCQENIPKEDYINEIKETMLANKEADERIDKQEEERIEKESSDEGLE